MRAYIFVRPMVEGQDITVSMIWRDEDQNKSVEKNIWVSRKMIVNGLEGYRIEITDFLKTWGAADFKARVLAALPKQRVMVNPVPDSDLVIGYNSALKAVRDAINAL